MLRHRIFAAGWLALAGGLALSCAAPAAAQCTGGAGGAGAGASLASGGSTFDATGSSISGAGQLSIAAALMQQMVLQQQMQAMQDQQMLQQQAQFLNSPATALAAPQRPQTVNLARSNMDGLKQRLQQAQETKARALEARLKKEQKAAKLEKASAVKK
jgi:hypothetical protein